MITEQQRKEAIERIEENVMALELMSPELRGDRGVVMAAVSQYVWMLQCVHDDLKKDRDFMLTAVSQDGEGSA